MTTSNSSNTPEQVGTGYIILSVRDLLKALQAAQSSVRDGDRIEMHDNVCIKGRVYKTPSGELQLTQSSVL